MPTKKQRLLEYLTNKAKRAREAAEKAEAMRHNFRAACLYEEAHEIGLHIEYVNSLPD